MRTMNPEKLLKTLPIIQNQLDALLDFDVSILSLVLGNTLLFLSESLIILLNTNIISYCFLHRQIQTN